MSNHLVSIIVPVYNVEEYIGECIDSLINQTYENIEIILVDDKSTDRSLDICKLYAAKDNRIIVVEREINSGGCGIPRNDGLDICKGEFIGFVDADDYVKENYIEILLDNFDNELLTVRCSLTDGSRSSYLLLGNKNIFDYKESLLDLFSEQKYISAYVWGCLYRRKDLEEVKFCKYTCEDTLFTAELLIKTKKEIKIINDKLYYLRYNENSITGSKFSRKKLDDIYVHEKCFNYIEKNDESLYKALYTKVLYKIAWYSIIASEYNDNSIKNELKLLYKKYKYNNDYKLISLRNKIVFGLSMKCPLLIK